MNFKKYDFVVIPQKNIVFGRTEHFAQDHDLL